MIRNARTFFRCPVCGRIALADGIERAGTHELHKRRVVRGLGRGRGFLWSLEELQFGELCVLRDATEKALAQLQARIDKEMGHEEKVIHQAERFYPAERFYAAERIPAAVRDDQGEDERCYPADRVRVGSVR